MECDLLLLMFDFQILRETLLEVKPKISFVLGRIIHLQRKKVRDVGIVLSKSVPKCIFYINMCNRMILQSIIFKWHC